jgi:hypothetical protein
MAAETALANLCYPDAKLPRWLSAALSADLTALYVRRVDLVCYECHDCNGMRATPMDGDGINGTIAARGPGGRFAAGNPGRPPGTRHKTTMAIQQLLAGEADGLTRKAVELALGGDVMALRLCLDRIAPPPKDAPIVFALPPLTCAQDAARAMAALVASVASGEITPGEAAGVASLVETWRKAHETGELEDRLTALEQIA